MSLEFRWVATAIGSLLHSGPQSPVHAALAGSLFAAVAEEILQPLPQTDDSLGNELAATRLL